MKKEEYSSHAFAESLRQLIALASAADTPPTVIYGLLRAWAVAYETLWQEFGVPPASIAELQTRSFEVAEKIAAEMRVNGAIAGKFPEEVPDPRESPVPEKEAP